MFRNAVKREYNVSGVESEEMRSSIKSWIDAYQGMPEWLDAEDDIKTIKFAKKIAEAVANLTTLDIDVAFDGERKDYMQTFWEKSVKPRLRQWVEVGSAAGTIILKPNGKGVDLMTPDMFEVVDVDGNGNIRGIVFQDSYVSNNMYYTKLEYHRFWSALVRINPESEEYTETTYYTVTNKAFASKDSSSIGHPVRLADTKWANLKDETNIVKKNDNALESMLFGVFKMPSANDIDFNSPLGVSIFANAMEELRDLDIAYSRNATEIFASKRLVLLDERLVQLPSVMGPDGKVQKRRMKLPKYARNVNADDSASFYQEINPNINIEQRKQEIDFQLSLIGTKCGFSNGYFVLDGKTGMITATQVEADDRETIQLVKDVRDALKTCLNELFYAQSVFADLYGIAPVGNYEANYNFGDITYNYEEDKQSWWRYVTAGKVPAWMYFVKFEGMSEEEAKAMTAEAEPKDIGLFAE